MGQSFVGLVNIALWHIGDWGLLIAKLVFTLYWGACQNVAHFQLQVGEYQNARVAARTYRLPLWLEYAVFRGGIRHLEHHLFPFVPGVRLNAEIVTSSVQERLGNPITISGGFKSYILDLLAQYRPVLVRR